MLMPRANSEGTTDDCSPRCTAGAGSTKLKAILKESEVEFLRANSSTRPRSTSAAAPSKYVDSAGSWARPSGVERACTGAGGGMCMAYVHATPCVRGEDTEFNCSARMRSLPASCACISLHKDPVFYLTRKLYAYVINIKD